MHISHYDRRRFLQLSMLTTAYSLTGLGGGVASAANGKTADVLVLGAGISGLSAARSLRRLGLDIIVIEARNRIGGRIWTNRDLPGINADLGAQWISDPSINPLAEFAQRHDIVTVPSDITNVSTRH